MHRILRQRLPVTFMQQTNPSMCFWQTYVAQKSGFLLLRQSWQVNCDVRHDTHQLYKQWFKWWLGDVRVGLHVITRINLKRVVSNHQSHMVCINTYLLSFDFLYLESLNYMHVLKNIFMIVYQRLVNIAMECFVDGRRMWKLWPQ